MDKTSFAITYIAMAMGFGIVLTCLVGHEFDRRGMDGAIAAACFCCAWTALALILASPLSHLVIK